MCERMYVVMVETENGWEPLVDGDSRPFVGNKDYTIFHQHFYSQLKPDLKLGYVPADGWVNSLVVEAQKKQAEQGDEQ